MNILAIETATEACSVALLTTDRICQKWEIAPRLHAEKILPMSEGLLSECGIRKNNLDAIAVSRGPGSFTGLRIGASMAIGMAMALDIPLAGIDTLKAMAHGAMRQHGNGLYYCINDARMDEVYLAVYRAEGGALTEITPASLASPAELNFDPAPAFVIGNALKHIPELAKELTKLEQLTCLADIYPQAQDIALLANAGDALQAASQFRLEYVRNRVAEPARK